MFDKAIFTIVLTATLAICLAAADQDPEWKGSRTNEKGFIEVRNPLVVWELMPNGSIAFAYPSDYQITIYASDGTIERRIRKKYTPTEVTEEEKRTAKRKIPSSIEYKPSKYRSAFRNVFVDEKGRLFVLTWEKGSRPETGVFDVFDQEGRYIYKVEFPGRTIFLKCDNLYTVESNEQGFHVIRKYRVSWNRESVP